MEGPPRRGGGMHVGPGHPMFGPGRMGGGVGGPPGHGGLLPPGARYDPINPPGEAAMKAVKESSEVGGFALCLWTQARRRGVRAVQGRLEGWCATGWCQRGRAFVGRRSPAPHRRLRPKTVFRCVWRCRSRLPGHTPAAGLPGFHPGDFVPPGPSHPHPDIMQPGPGRGTDFDDMFG